MTSVFTKCAISLVLCGVKSVAFCKDRLPQCQVRYLLVRLQTRRLEGDWSFASSLLVSILLSDKDFLHLHLHLHLLHLLSSQFSSGPKIAAIQISVPT